MENDSVTTRPFGNGDTLTITRRANGSLKSLAVEDTNDTGENNASWQRFTITYNDSGTRVLSRELVQDNGITRLDSFRANGARASRTVTDSSDNLRGWQTRTDMFDASGTRLVERIFVFDNTDATTTTYATDGSRTVVKEDASGTNSGRPAPRPITRTASSRSRF